MPLHMIRDDLSTFAVDAIVNSTSSDFTATGGLDLQLRLAAGEKLAEAIASLSPPSVGEIVVTEGFALPCHYLLHTVAPEYEEREEDEALLAACYQNALKKADSLGCESIAFPLIGAGLLGFPRSRVMKIATAAIAEFLMDHEMTVYISIFDKTEFSIDRRLRYDLAVYIGDEMDLPPMDDLKRLAAEKRGRINAYAANESPIRRNLRRADFMTAREVREIPPAPVEGTLEDVLNELDAPFSEVLFRLIDAKGITDVECYKRSNVDKKTFSKIKCNPDYRPSKLTAVSFAVGLHLTLDEAEGLLRTVGLCLSKSNKFDLIIRYFLSTGRYDTIFDVNEMLYHYDLATLGC